MTKSSVDSNLAKPLYQYHVQTWGGFYNDEYKKIHGKEPGDYLFDTEEEREKFIIERKEIEGKLNARHLVISKTEGFCCNIRTVLHRVIEFDTQQYYTFYDMGINYPISAAKYHLQWKWYPGFNDYPLGGDFDYKKVTIVQQWVTGADSEIEIP